MVLYCFTPMNWSRMLDQSSLSSWLLVYIWAAALNWIGVVSCSSFHPYSRDLATLAKIYPKDCVSVVYFCWSETNHHSSSYLMNWCLTILCLVAILSNYLCLLCIVMLFDEQILVYLVINHIFLNFKLILSVFISNCEGLDFKTIGYLFMLLVVT